jgi:CheY-like chemotaxis protein
MLKLVRDRDATLEGRRILIVDDDVRNIFARSSLLEPHGVSGWTMPGRSGPMYCSTYSIRSVAAISTRAARVAWGPAFISSGRSSRRTMERLGSNASTNRALASWSPCHGIHRSGENGPSLPLNTPRTLCDIGRVVASSNEVPDWVHCQVAILKACCPRIAPAQERSGK